MRPQRPRARHVRPGEQREERRGRQHVRQLLERVVGSLRDSRHTQQQQRTPHGVSGTAALVPAY